MFQCVSAPPSSYGHVIFQFYSPIHPWWASGWFPPLAVVNNVAMKLARHLVSSFKMVLGNLVSGK